MLICFKQMVLVILMSAVWVALRAQPVSGALAGSAQRKVEGVSRINPLTGTPLGYEAEERLLDRARLQTRILEQQARQAELKAAIRKQAGLNPYGTRLQKPPLVRRFRRSRKRLAPSRGFLHLARKKPVRDRFNPKTQLIQNTPSHQGPTLDAIIQGRGQNVAVLTDSGVTRFVRTGGLYQGQAVTVMGPDSVTIGGRRLGLKARPSIISRTIGWPLARHSGRHPPRSPFTPPPGMEGSRLLPVLPEEVPRPVYPVH
ncbi:MAG: hypothetical protein KGQ58_07505 [Proteobacteria bacterium]|nr:hypothetical protein [Pseudomonadota bacterium]MDE3207427.1 hypothetical protein [Pseudomonadota bacterium]